MVDWTDFMVKGAILVGLVVSWSVLCYTRGRLDQIDEDRTKQTKHWWEPRLKNKGTDDGN